MKASKAASASLFVSAIQIACKARLAFACWLFGSLFKMFAVLCTQQRCSRVLGHTSPSAFQKPSAPSTAPDYATAAIAGYPQFGGEGRKVQAAKDERIRTLVD